MKIETLPLGQLDTNCYIVYDEAACVCAVIDPGACGGRIAARVQELGLRMQCVLLTHSHFDHIGGLSALLQELPAPVYVTAEDAADPSGLSYGMLRYTDLYREGDELNVGAVRLRVMHTPGHTPGSVCLLTDGVLFSGDTLFAGACGRTDFRGGSMDRMLCSLRRLAQLPEQTIVLPGHGERTTIREELRSNPYVREALEG